MALSCVLPLRTCIATPASTSSGTAPGEHHGIRNSAALGRGGSRPGELGQQQQPWQNGRCRLQMRKFSSQRENLGQELTPRRFCDSSLGKQFSSSGEALKIWSWGTSRAPQDFVGRQGRGSADRQGVSTFASSVTAVEEAVESSAGEIKESVDSELTKEEPKLAGGEGGDGRDGGDRGGGGGGGGDGTGNEGKGPKRKLTASQYLTLLYALLVGAGGIVGFVKTGSAKSLFSGGGAALLLLVVYIQLSVRPTIASILGLGISAVLLGVMYPRFQSSGKFMPAGLVALVSLIMSGGYLHGIVRTSH